MNTLVPGITAFCFLLLAFAGIKRFSQYSSLPAEAWILIVGIGYGLLLKNTDTGWLPEIVFDPQVVLFLFLPLLIFASGRLINLKTFKSEALSIGFFATVGVLVTCVVIGIPIAWILDIPLLHGLLIGAAASATDPTAIATLFNVFNIPQRLSLILEGESLFNDSTTVVLFALIMGLLFTDSMFDLTHSVLHFIWIIFAAMLLGALLGWLGAKLLTLLGQDQMYFNISLGLALAYSGFLISEKVLNASGVITVLMAAIVFTRSWDINYRSSDTLKSGDNNNSSSEVIKSFWEYITDIINGLIFFALGTATGNHNFEDTPSFAVIVSIAALITARFVLIYAGGSLLHLVKKPLSIAWKHVLFLGGLKGSISAALVLLIPHDYAYRSYFLCLAFAMIAFSLIVQPVLVKLYLKRANLSNNH